MIQKNFISFILLGLLASPLKATTCNVPAFITWHSIHFTKSDSAVKVLNLNNETLISHTSLGHLFSNSFGGVYILPSVKTLIEEGQGYLQPYQEAVRQLRQIDFGLDFLKFRISSDIKEWATSKDNISHSGEDVPSFSWGTRTKPYVLPDQSTIYLSPETHSVLVNNWAVRYRPGDM